MLFVKRVLLLLLRTPPTAYVNVGATLLNGGSLLLNIPQANFATSFSCVFLFFNLHIPSFILLRRQILYYYTNALMNEIRLVKFSVIILFIPRNCMCTGNLLLAKRIRRQAKKIHYCVESDDGVYSVFDVFSFCNLTSK